VVRPPERNPSSGFHVSGPPQQSSEVTRVRVMSQVVDSDYRPPTEAALQKRTCLNPRTKVVLFKAGNENYHIPGCTQSIV
jgi:hypothetical protein